MENDLAAATFTAKGVASQPEETQDSQASQSAIDTGLSKRPRDAHTIHLILNQYGVNAYQERVPLQLMDFAYRYTSGMLQDSLHFVNESYPGLQGSAGSIGGGARNTADAATIVNLSALRLAIRSRTHYQYNPNLSKEFYTDLMTEKNKIALPPVHADAGLHLPPEQYMLTGQHWEMGENADLMDTDPLDVGEAAARSATLAGAADGDDEVEGGTMEDLFGRSSGVEEDETMED